MKVKGHWCMDQSTIEHHSWHQEEPLLLFLDRQDSTCRICANEEDLITAKSFTPL